MGTTHIVDCKISYRQSLLNKNLTNTDPHRALGMDLNFKCLRPGKWPLRNFETVSKNSTNIKFFILLILIFKLQKKKKNVFFFFNRKFE